MSDSRSNGSDSELLLYTRSHQDAALQTSSDSSTRPLQADDSAAKTTQTVPDPSPIAKPDRHDELWFDDGDLVIIAGNVEFRVYREPIARHSSILSDVMSAQEPTRRTESDIAAPPYTEIHLSDSPEDVQYFLQAFVTGKTLWYVSSSVKVGTADIMR